MWLEFSLHVPASEAWPSIWALDLMVCGCFWSMLKFPVALMQDSENGYCFSARPTPRDELVSDHALFVIQRALAKWEGVSVRL